jgi:hypothetical protein
MFSFFPPFTGPSFLPDARGGQGLRAFYYF